MYPFNGFKQVLFIAIASQYCDSKVELVTNKTAIMIGGLSLPLDNWSRLTSFYLYLKKVS